jgi:hypothetical protein
MTLSDISLAQYINSQLRKAVVAGDLTDYNSASRTSTYGNWIYPDTPMLKKLLGNVNNFPRISVESLSHSTVSEMGMEDSAHLESDTIKINIWSVRDLICTVKSTTNETIVYDATETTYALANLPTSEITEVTDDVPTTFVRNTDYQLIDSNNSGFYNAIKWLGVDTPSDGADFYVDYNRKAVGAELTRLVAQNLNTYFKTWRDWDEKIVWNYQLISSAPILFDEQFGVFRHEIVIKFEGINIGDSV